VKAIIYWNHKIVMKMCGTRIANWKLVRRSGRRWRASNAEGADAKKFEEEQENDESLRAWWKLAEASGVTEREENYGDETSA